MATQTDINNGMSLDEILGSDAPAEVFGSLKDPTIKDLDDSLNSRVPGGISELLKRLQTPGENVQLVADALVAELQSFTTDIDNVIDSDLAVQTDLKQERATVDLTSVILPEQVLQPELLEIVTTDQFKKIVETYGQPESS